MTSGIVQSFVHGKWVVKMKAMKVIAAGLMAAVFAASGAFAKTEDLGLLTSAGKTFGNSFYSNTSAFTDYYTFSLGDFGDVSGATKDTSYVFWFSRDVSLSSLVLSSSSGVIMAKDVTADSFTFSGLAQGDYKLTVQGKVTGLGGVGSYEGTIKAVTSAVASPAPEAADFAMTAIGLAGVAFMVRRRRAAR